MNFFNTLMPNYQSRLAAGATPGAAPPVTAPQPGAAVSNMTPPQNIFAARAAGAPMSFARPGMMQPNNGVRMGGGPPMSAGPIAMPVRTAPNPVAAGAAPGMPGAPNVPPQAAWPIAQNFLRQRLMGLG